jgi:DNA-binding transcriptional regulator YiaG
MTTQTARTRKKSSPKKVTRRRPLQPSAAHGLVAELRQKLGLSRKIFARLTGFSERAIANWEAGDKPDEPGMRRIRETERFQAKLADVVRPEDIPEWLDTPQEAFDGLKPLEVIERGEIDRLWNMIYYLESGVAS